MGVSLDGISEDFVVEFSVNKVSNLVSCGQVILNTA